MTYCGFMQYIHTSRDIEVHTCIKPKGHSGPHTDGRFTWTQLTPTAATS